MSTRDAVWTCFPLACRLFAIAELDPAATVDTVRFVKGTLNDFTGGTVCTPVAGANPFFRRSGESSRRRREVKRMQPAPHC